MLGDLLAQCINGRVGGRFECFALLLGEKGFAWSVDFNLRNLVLVSFRVVQTEENLGVHYLVVIMGELFDFAFNEID